MRSRENEQEDLASREGGETVAQRGILARTNFQLGLPYLG